MHTDRVRIVPIALTLAFLSATASGCGHRAPAAAETETLSASLALKTIRPQRQTLRRIIEEPGQIEPYEHTPIFANIAGYVSEVCVDMDARVKKGEVLARLFVPERVDDVAEKEAMTAKAQAQLVQAQKTFKAVEAHCRTTEALVAQAISERKRARANCDYWRSESQRIDKMVRRNVIDEQQRDEALNQFKAASAGCEEIEAKIHSAEASRDESVAQRFKAEADVAAARTHLRVTETQTQRAKTMLAYADVKAPFDGVVTKRNVHTRWLVGPGQTDQGQPLFLVVRRDRVRIFVDVPEPEAPFVRQGAPVRLRIQGLNDREFEATVTRTSYVLDPTSRTLRAEVEVLNSKDELRPGMYAYALITAEHAGAFTLPIEALLREGDDSYCWQLLDGKAARTLVRPGPRIGGRIEVLKKRLSTSRANWQDFSGGEQILLGDVAGLADGQGVSSVSEMTSIKE